jgi:hypothetical protein
MNCRPTRGRTVGGRSNGCILFRLTCCDVDELSRVRPYFVPQRNRGDRCQILIVRQNPGPFVQFWAAGGTTVGGEIRVTASSPFYFKSVDLYSSTTPIPYTIKGLRRSNTVFILTDALPNTFGNFRTVANPHSGDIIDALSIALTNAAAPCCRNPMGLDNIIITQ